jgi:site-specific recombinase XerD
MKVSAILKGKPDQFNRYPIVIRINEGEKRTFHVTPFKATKQEFKDGLDEVTSAKVRRMAIEYERRALDGIRKYRDAEFFEYVDKCIKEWDQVRAYNTIRNYKAERDKLKTFRSSFKLSQVTPDFLHGYSNYLYSIGNISTTVWSSFKFIRTVILKAIRERLIEENPFHVFKMEAYKDPAKEYLTKEEINKIEKFLPESGSLRLCSTWFVIGCYTGLRYSDMNAFTKEKNIKGNRIVLTTVKNKEVVSMPLSKRLQKLLESINYQPMFISNQKFNEALKQISVKLKLSDLSVHKARHSFGVMCADAGISQEVTARLMGHRSLKSTAIYYKITNPRIDREIKKLG